jgi:hypothetical protein
MIYLNVIRLINYELWISLLKFEHEQFEVLTITSLQYIVISLRDFFCKYFCHHMQTKNL